MAPFAGDGCAAPGGIRRLDGRHHPGLPLLAGGMAVGGGAGAGDVGAALAGLDARVVGEGVAVLHRVGDHAVAGYRLRVAFDAAVVASLGGVVDVRRVHAGDEDVGAKGDRAAVAAVAVERCAPLRARHSGDDAVAGVAGDVGAGLVGLLAEGLASTGGVVVEGAQVLPTRHDAGAVAGGLGVAVDAGDRTAATHVLLVGVGGLGASGAPHVVRLAGDRVEVDACGGGDLGAMAAGAAHGGAAPGGGSRFDGRHHAGEALLARGVAVGGRAGPGCIGAALAGLGAGVVEEGVQVLGGVGDHGVAGHGLRVAGGATDVVPDHAGLVHVLGVLAGGEDVAPESRRAAVAAVAVERRAPLGVGHAGDDAVAGVAADVGAGLVGDLAEGLAVARGVVREAVQVLAPHDQGAAVQRGLGVAVGAGGSPRGAHVL